MIYGITKGTEFEKLCEGAAKAEAAGVMMYYALARMAKEQGYPEEVSEKFIEMANQEAVHAGFYATLSGKYDADIWQLAEAFAARDYRWPSLHYDRQSEGRLQADDQERQI